jgi:cytochrome b561
MSPFLAFIAHATHVLFYVVIIGVPLTGLLLESAVGGLHMDFFGLGWFKWPILPFFHGLTRPQGMALSRTFINMHMLLAFATIGLLVLHVAAALKHHYWDKDDVLRRMLPDFGGST